MEFDGYIYTIQSRSRTGTQYLKCKFKKSDFCPGTGKLEGGEFTPMKAHNHQPKQDVVGIFRKVLVQRAVDEVTPLKTIYDEEAPRHLEGATRYAYATAEITMRAARRRNLPAIPETLVELGRMMMEGDLNQRYQCCGRSICKSTVTTENGSQAIIFYCQNLLDSVTPNIQELHCDGTFKVVPDAPESQQLFTMHGIVQNSSRSRAAYDEVVRVVKTAAPTLAAALIITDFESAMQQALRDGWPAAEIKGCYFHFAQAIWKRNARNYLALINTNVTARKVVKLLMGLALLPSNRAREGFDEVLRFARQNNLDMEQTFQYIDRYWFGRVGPETFSVYGLPRRTNNNIEAFHNTLKGKFMPVNHPNVWRFLDDLQKCLATDHVLVNQVRAGNINHRGRKTYLANDRRIQDARHRLELEQITLFEYLERIAYVGNNIEECLRNWRNAVGEDDNVEDVEVEEPFDHPPVPANVDPPAPAAVPNILPAAANRPVDNVEEIEVEEPFVNPPVPANVVPPAAIPNVDGPPAPVAVPNILPAAANKPVGAPVDHDYYILSSDDEDQPEESDSDDEAEFGQEYIGIPRRQVNNWEPHGADTVVPEDDDQTRTCPVCLTNYLAAALQCGHCFCIACSKELYDHLDACTHCRQLVVSAPIILFANVSHHGEMRKETPAV